MSNNKPAIHPELLKMFNSPLYRKKVKRAVVALKSLHNINHKLSRKGSSLTPDTSTAHYFSQHIDTSSERRSNQNISKQK